MATLAERNRRILTTHAGSLPRRASLSALLFARMSRKPFDAQALGARNARGGGGDRAQAARVGIDVVSDGEQSKTSFQHYISDRLSGIEPITPKAGERRTRENMAFPTFYKDGAHSGSQQPRFACTGPIKYTGHKQLAEGPGEPQGGARRAGSGRRLRPVGLAVELRRHDGEPPLQDRRRACPRRRRGAARGIRGHRGGGLQVQIDDPRLAMHYMLSPDEIGRGRARLGAPAASRCSITRCATSRPSASAITPATASTWARAPATWR